MKIYWSANQVPGFKDLSKGDRKAVWQMAYFGLMKQWQTYAIVVPLIVAIVFILPESMGPLRSGIAAALSIYATNLKAYMRLPHAIKRFHSQKNQWSALPHENPLKEG